MFISLKFDHRNLYNLNMSIDIYLKNELFISIPIFDIFDDLSYSLITQCMIIDLLTFNVDSDDLQQFYTELRSVITRTGLIKFSTCLFDIKVLYTPNNPNDRSIDISHIIKYQQIASKLKTGTFYKETGMICYFHPVTNSATNMINSGQKQSKNISKPLIINSSFANLYLEAIKPYLKK